MSWLPNSGVYRTLITERQYKSLLEVSPGMKLRRNKVRFTPYASNEALPVIGKVKLVLKNLNRKKVKCMAYVVEGGKECLLGRRDGEALGVIHINPRGNTPTAGSLDGGQEQEQHVSRLETLHLSADKQGLDQQTQDRIEADIKQIVDKYPAVFSGIGKV